jgi:hypothetical protein
VGRNECTRGWNRVASGRFAVDWAERACGERR